MRIAICEDERVHAALLESEIEKWAATTNDRPQVEHFSSAEEFLMVWPDEKDFDLVFLDIQMKHIDGFELASIIRAKDEDMVIVFVTGLWDHVLHGYDLRALKYIIKPIKTADCMKILDTAVRLTSRKKDDYIIIRQESMATRLLYDDIRYFEIKSHYIDVATANGHITYKAKMSSLEEALPSPQFFRCHRSFIVNMYHVQMIQPDKVLMDDGTVIPVARARWADLNETFMAYHANR